MSAVSRAGISPYAPGPTAGLGCSPVFLVLRVQQEFCALLTSADDFLSVGCLLGTAKLTPLSPLWLVMCPGMGSSRPQPDPAGDRVV